MANVKISDLPAASSVAAGDLFEVSQGSGTLTSRKATGTQVQSFVLDSYAGGSSIATVGTIGTGTWQGSVVAGQYGGTGVNNSGKTITLGGNFATSGAYALTLTLTAATTVTLPTTGTLATLAGAETLISKTLKGQSVQYYNSGTTSALDYTNGSHQRWAPTGSVSLTVTNWPASGVLGELLIEGINLGSATITWPTVNWIKSDGTTTTTFASNGVTLQATGTDWVFLWTRDGGTTVYGKIVR
jgi:hypothetical protein